LGNTNEDIGKYLSDPKINPNGAGLSGGHAAGVNPWEPPYIHHLTPDAIMPLKKNMLFSVEPYAGIPGIGGFRLENQFFVGEKEPEIITPLPFDERLLRDVHPLDRTTGRRKEYRQLCK
jgi:Xaa-Pro aminopeptidase